MKTPRILPLPTPSSNVKFQLMLKLSREQILLYASRYIGVDNPDFPLEGDLFYFLIRKAMPAKPMKTKDWQFAGYALCRGYVLDEEAKPHGKWLFMYYLDLAQFPLKEHTLKLQPPHVALGQFQTPDRDKEIRMCKCQITREEGVKERTENKKKQSSHLDNVITFKKKT